MKYENPTKYLVIAFAILLSSCGARKSETKTQETKIDQVETAKEVVAESSEKETETNVKTETERVVDKKTNVVIETVKVTPIDNTKPSSFKNEKGVIVDLTNSIYEKQIKTDLSNVKEQLNTIEVYYKKELEKAKKQSEKDKQTILKLQQKLKEKAVDKEQFNFYSLLWLLLLLLIPIGYYGYRFVKNYHLNIKV